MKSILTLLSLATPALTFAHPGHGGHGGSGFTIIHYLTEPDHALIALLGVAIIGFGVYKLVAKKEDKSSRNA